MLIKGSKIKIIDNSGASMVKVIKVSGGSHRRHGRIGDVAVCSVKTTKIAASKAPRGSVVRVLIVGTKYNTKLGDGSCVRFDSNIGVIINKQDEPLGTRVIGPVSKQIKDFYPKVASLSEETF